MSHNSAPNNLTEVCNAIIAYIQKGNLTIDELLEYMPGPDFPLPNVVINKKDIKSAFATGHSVVSLKIRGLYEIEGNNVIFTTIPYRTYRDKITEQIQNNIEEFEKFLEDFEDESSLGQNRLVFKLKKDANIQKAINQIFALTDLQTTLSYNMNFIINGTPKLCSMIDLIKAYVEHQTSVLVKATQYDKEKAEKRKHILDGLMLILADIDEAIKIIRASENKQEAKNNLKTRFLIDDSQAEAVLDMKLSRLTKLDKIELESERQEKLDIIDKCNKIITNQDYRNQILIDKITELRDKYGDERRTQLIDLEIPKEEKEIEYIEPEKCVVTLTEAGTLKRVSAASFKPQNRGGKGVRKEEEITKGVIRTNTVDNLMVFSNKGVMYKILVNDIPEGKATAAKALLPIAPDEKASVIYSIYHDTTAKYVLFVTKNGLIKKTALKEYIELKKKNGVGAIKLKEGDELTSVCLIDQEDIVIATHDGMGIRFNSADIGSSSRLTMGVRAIDLKANDYVVSALPIRDKKDDIAIFSTSGLGKRIEQSELPTQGRGGKGLIIYKASPSTGYVAAIQMLCDTDQVLISGNKSNICIKAADMPVLKRASAGVKLANSGLVTGVSKV